MKHIAHLTSAHPRYDTRIFHKMCLSLRDDYDVSLVVADGKGDEVCEGVRIYDVGKPSGRLERMRRTTRQVYERALALDAALYHLHDPELIPVGLKLKRAGKRVIFDAHEDLPKQLVSKHYLPAPLKPIASAAAARYECRALRRFDGVVAATPFIAEKFERCGVRAVSVENFPDAELFLPLRPKLEDRKICYIGALYPTRGIEEIVRAAYRADAELIVAGRFGDAEYERYLRTIEGWERVDYRGFLDQSGVREVLEASAVGMVTLHPTPSYVEAYPVKMFEYMAAGLGVIASDFPLYKTFVEESGCGECVDPRDVDAIADAMRRMLSDTDALRRKSRNGKRAVRERFNWANEAAKLKRFYKELGL
jgi:glycosyltransferase involved in cell wall biosynthesis